jgi:uncharacterized tellurite resistance protein B-like protein
LTIALSIFILLALLYLMGKSPSKKQTPSREKATAGPSKSADIEDKDSWEGSFWDASNPKQVKAKLRLVYVDASGAQSSRTVDVRQFGELPDTTLLIGKCMLRNATRTFRSDRIQQCVAEDTGEIITDVTAYLRDLHNGSPDKAVQTLLEAEMDILKVLLFVGKADGQLRAAERLVIKDTCTALTGDTRIDDETVRDLLGSMDVPSLAAFQQAVGRLSKRSDDQRRAVITAAQAIVDTQKTVHPSEQSAIDYMTQRLNISAS